LYMLVGRFFVDWYQRTRMFYGVTDQRVIIIDGVFNRQVKSLTLASLSDISLVERSRGTGTITFGPASTPSSFFGRSSWRGMNGQQGPSFDMIEDARKVYTLIRDAQQTGRKRSA
jgi:hypothetical protein